ncbi:unnamed protein product [Mucor circinelloides]
MVDDEETKDLITWTGAGDQFTVFNNVDFSRNVLPRYFKHCNWSSFVRQLNMYDFHKINDQNDDENFNISNAGSSSSHENDNMVQKWDFKHPWFTKTGYDRLHKIRRKPPRNRLIPQMRYSNAMELVDDGSEVESNGAPSTSTPSPYMSNPPAMALSSSAPPAIKADGVQHLVSQLHDTTKSFESKLDYTCNEILYLRSVVDSQQMVLNELYNSVEYLKSRQMQKEAEVGFSGGSNNNNNHMDGEEARKPRKIHELLEINHEAQRLPQLQQQQQLQEPRTRRESSLHVHQSQNYREEEADNDYSGYQDYDDRPIGRRKKRSEVEK